MDVQQNTIECDVDGLKDARIDQSLSPPVVSFLGIKRLDQLTGTMQALWSHQQINVPAWSIAHLVVPSLLGGHSFKRGNVDSLFGQQLTGMGERSRQLPVPAFREETLSSETEMKVGIHGEFTGLSAVPHEAHHPMLKRRLQETGLVVHRRKKTAGGEFD